MANEDVFSLDRFEYLTYSRQYELAAREMLKLLTHLDTNLGLLGDVGNAPTGDLLAEQRDAHFATRIASAVTALFSDPAFELSDLGFQQLIHLQRWLTMIFGASPFGNADHIIHLLNQKGYENRDEITVTARDYFRLCLLYSLESEIPLQPEAVWNENRRLAASLFVALLSARIAASEQAHAKKEYLLEWFPPRLKELSLDDFPVGILHDVWMHCSYATRRDKHTIKATINTLIRRKLLESGLTDVVYAPPPERDKPVIMVVCEWFSSNHSNYRTHSMSVEALRQRYRVVGVLLEGVSDEIAHRSFDEVHVVPRAHNPLMYTKVVSDLANQIRPDLVYFVAVGMFPTTIFLCNLRLAPIQMVTWGHSASTFSPCIDYYMVEEDLFGDAECFSEQVVALPKDALPYRPPANCPSVPPVLRDAPDPVRIAVAASVMKLNPDFLKSLKRIAETAKVKVEFHFYTGFAFGLGKVYVQNLIHRFIPDCAVVYPHLAYEPYIQNLNRCDMFVNPFPFGNCNGIVDAVRQGLVGVCWSGPELHSHIDEGLFKRLGLPEWLITRSIDEYVAAAVRLVEDHRLRSDLRKEILKINPDTVLFQGNAQLFADAVEWLERNHAEIRASGNKLLRPPVKAPAMRNQPRIPAGRAKRSTSQKV